jgi:hypothetical protein
MAALRLAFPRDNMERAVLKASDRMSHSPRLGGFALLLTLFSPIAAHASGPAVSLSAESISCPTDAQVRRALEQRLGPRRVLEVPANKGEATVELSSPSPGKILITLLDPRGEPQAEKLIDVVAGECRDASQTVALLVETWLQSLPLVSGGPLVGVRSKTRHTLQSGTIARPDNGVGRGQPIAPVKEGDSASPASVVEGEVASEPQRGGREFARIRLALLGGASLATALDQPSWHGAANAEVALTRRVGAALRLGLEGAQKSSAGSGEVSARPSSAALLVRLCPYAGQSRELGVQAGAGVDLIATRGAGYAIDRAQTLLDAGLWAGVEWRQRLGRRVFAAFAVEGHLRLRKEAIGIESLGPVLTLSPARLSVLAGLGVELL